MKTIAKDLDVYLSSAQNSQSNQLKIAVYWIRKLFTRACGIKANRSKI